MTGAIPRQSKNAARSTLRVRFRLLPVAQVIFQKVQRSGSRNKT